METDKLVVKFHQELFSMHKYKLLSGTIIQLRNSISQPLECEEDTNTDNRAESESEG